MPLPAALPLAHVPATLPGYAVRYRDDGFVVWVKDAPMPAGDGREAHPAPADPA